MARQVAALSARLLGSVALLILPRIADAQEFVRQAVLVAPFRSDSAPGAATLARDVARMVRERTAARLDPREAKVVDGFLLENLLIETGYTRTTIPRDFELRVSSQKLRADEIVRGVVTRQNGAIVVTARLALLRSWDIQQPLPVVRAATAALAADALAQEIVKARAQLVGLRRCENALAKSDRATAVREAERAIRAYPPAVMARDCLIAALLDGTTAADSLRRIADEVLAFDSTNTYAAVTRADMLEVEKRAAPAVAQWARVLALHPDSLPLGTRVVEALLRLQQPATALADTRQLRATFPNDATLRRLHFRAHSALAHWKDAAALGDTLENEDATFRADSNYATRYIESLRQSGDSLAALEISVRAVRRYPHDARIYLQYLQVLGAETIGALPRGLATFPDIPELYTLAATAARKAGKRADAVRATREAIRRDSTRTQQFLVLADLYFEDNQLDSLTQVLTRAPRTGDAADMLRTYVIARGLTVLRAAGDSLPAAQQAAVSLLVLADSIDSRTDSRAYVAAASLQMAREQLLQASKRRTCTDSRAADATLGLSASAISRGLGDGANAAEIQSAFDAMRAAVDNANTVLCKG